MSLNQNTIDVTILGNHIDSVIKRTTAEFVAHKTKSNDEYDSYGVTEASSFFQAPVNFYMIKTDAKGIIQQLSFDIQSAKDNLDFFDKLNQVFGEPIDIYCLGSIKWEEEIVANGMSYEEGWGKPNKCALTDDPYLVRWKYNDIYIEYVMKGYAYEVTRRSSIYVSFMGVSVPRVKNN